MPEKVRSGRATQAAIPGKITPRWPAIVVSSSQTTAAVSRAVRRGELRKIGPRLYTSDLSTEPERVVRRHLIEIVAGLAPGAVIVDRSAATPGYVAEGILHLAHDGPERIVELPGLRLRIRPGCGPVEGDERFGDDRLFRSSAVRTIVENLLPSRARQGARARLDRAELEEYVDGLLRQRGRADLEGIDERIPGVAAELGVPELSPRAQGLVRAFLGSEHVAAASTLLRARQRGAPYDPDRLGLFEALVDALHALPSPRRAGDWDAQRELPFFEAYFSNFIEGTEFAVEEARRIVATHSVPAERPEDGHDVLGTYAICSDPREMHRIPQSAAELTEMLLSRHATLLAARPDKSPGMWKRHANRAGGTRFVEPDLVVGTLGEGYAIGRVLSEPFARALYIGFLVSEIHPFEDGNGRISRLFMNAELAATGKQRIVIPTVHRRAYLAGLRTLSQDRSPRPMVAALDLAQEFGAALPWHSFEETLAVLESTDAFLDDRDAQLRLPRPPTGA